MRTQNTSVEINGIAHVDRVRATETLEQAQDRIRREHPVVVNDDKPKPDQDETVKGRLEHEARNFTPPLELDRRLTVSTLRKHMRAHLLKHHHQNTVGGHR